MDKPTKILIAQAPGTSANPLDRTCRLKISCGQNETESEITANVVEELDKINKSIKWYMEVFAVDQPFQEPKAQEISQSLLPRYANELIKAIRLDLVAPGCSASSHLVIHVQEDAAVGSLAPADVGILRWEALQNVRIWPKELTPASVSVMRLVRRTSPTTEVVAAAAPAKTGSNSILNILAVTARPNGVNDIPHRLITKSIYDIVAKANEEAEEQSTGESVAAARPMTTLKIVRPGSLKALENELKNRKYDILHLDLHGEVENDVAYALFMHQNKPRADRVSAERLAKLLRRHGVQTVVLNACQSAVEGGGPATNLAKSLIQSGIRMAIAMAYSVLDYSARLFVCAFYDQRLRSRRSSLLSAQAARQCLLDKRIKETKYLTKVPVDDYLVPSVYLCHEEDSEEENDEITLADLEDLKKNPPKLPAEKFIDSEAALVGREGELLVLETFLVVDSCIVCIEGLPGVGKSALIRSAALWWKSTTLIDRFVWIDANALSPSQPLWELLNRELKLGLPSLNIEPETTEEGWKEIRVGVRQALRRVMKASAGLLIVFDGVESSGPRKTSAPDLKFLDNFLSVFRGIQEEKSGKSFKHFIILTARRIPKLDSIDLMEGERVSDNQNRQRLIHRLAPLGEASALRLAKHTLKAEKYPHAKDWEGRLVVGQLGKLAQGNPLALKMLIGVFNLQAQTLLEFLQSLLAGGKIRMDQMDQAALEPSSILPTDFAEHVAVSDARRLLRLSNERPAAAHAFYPFWAPFQCKALEDYISYIRFERDKGGPPRFQLRENQVLAEECGGFGDDEIKILYQKDMGFPFSSTSTAKKILQPFIDEDFVIIGKLRDGRINSATEYVSLHPLIPLMMRDEGNLPTATLDDARDTAQAVMPKLFRYRIKSWPLQAAYWKKAWDGPREIMRWEFYNFLAAAYRALNMKRSVLTVTMLINLVHSATKGVFWDAGRRPLLATFWRTAIDRLQRERQLARIYAADRPRVVAVNDWLLRLLGAFCGNHGEPNVRLLTDTPSESLRLQSAFAVEMCQLIFCMALWEYNARNDEDTALAWLDRMKRIYADRTRVPGADKMVQRTVGELIRLASASRKVESPSENFTSEQMSTKAEARRQFYNSVATTGFDTRGFDAGKLRLGALGAARGESESQDDDVDDVINDGTGAGMMGLGNSLLGRDENVYVAVLLAKREMKRRPPNVEEARRLLYKALDNDLVLGESPTNIATIHKILSEEVEESAAQLLTKGKEKTQQSGEDGGIEDRSETQRDHWRRALYHWEQALETEKQTGHKMSPEEARWADERTAMLKACVAGSQPSPNPQKPSPKDKPHRAQKTGRTTKKAALTRFIAEEEAKRQTNRKEDLAKRDVKQAEYQAYMKESAMNFWKDFGKRVEAEGGPMAEDEPAMKELKLIALAVQRREEMVGKIKGGGSKIPEGPDESSKMPDDIHTEASKPSTRTELIPDAGADQPLTAEQLADARDIFSLIDRTGFGEITPKHLGVFFRSLGESRSDKELQEIIQEVDRKQKGTIDFEDFLKIFPRLETAYNDQELREAFDMFDLNQDGYISHAELQHRMVLLGEKLTEEEVDEMIQEADLDGDGRINYEEFVRLMRSA